MKQMVILLLMLVLSEGALGQPGYQLILKNDVISSSTTYDFDIYLVGGTSFELASLQAIMTYNTAISSGTVSFSLIAGTSDLNDLQKPTSMTVSGSELRIAARTPPGAGSGTTIPTSPGLRVGQFRVTSSVAFSTTEKANIAWKNATDGNPYTKVNAYVSAVNTDITNESSNLNYLDNNTLPVTLVSFTGSVSASQGWVLLQWKTASEVNNYGYTVQRKGGADTVFADLANAFIAGKGTTVEQHSYSYVDKSITVAGKYTYRLKQQDLDGTLHYSQSVIVNVTTTDVAEVAPKVFQLLQNYPNPFNPATQVKFSVETTGKAVVKVYNMLGAEVATLFEGVAEAGRYYVAKFDGTKLATGIYFYRLTTEKKTDVKRMLMVK